MKWPFPKTDKITSKFDEPRPLSNPGEHVHGAIDVAGPVNSPIISPESGKLILYFAIRHDTNQEWPDDRMDHWPFRDYFHDVWGAIAVLYGDSGMTHLFAHAYMNQLFNRLFTKKHWGYVEQKEDDRFPLFSFILEKDVKAGKKISFIGNAGYSTGAHCHYEIHNGREWTRWENRENPMRLYRGQYEGN